MSIFQKFWGTVPVSPHSKGIKVFSALWKRFLHCIARYFPLMPGWRVIIHRMRGVQIGKRVFIGTEVFIDDADPASVHIEDDVTIIAQSTLIGHAYYPDHFSKILKNASNKRGITIEKGAYLGLRTTVLPGITIGKYAIVGAGSVVVKDVPPYTMVMGMSAKPVKVYSYKEINR